MKAQAWLKVGDESDAIVFSQNDRGLLVASGKRSARQASNRHVLTRGGEAARVSLVLVRILYLTFDLDSGDMEDLHLTNLEVFGPTPRPNSPRDSSDSRSKR